MSIQPSKNLNLVVSQSNAASGVILFGFDWDGTLFDEDDIKSYVTPAHNYAIEQMREKGVEPKEGENIIRGEGESSSDYFRRLYPKNEHFEQAAEIKNKVLLENSKIYEKAYELMRQIFSKGHKAFIATNYKSPKVMKPIMEKHFINPLKEEFSDANVPLLFSAEKPKPDSLYQGAKAHGLEQTDITQQNLVYIGNSAKDVIATLLAGGKAIFINKNDGNLKAEMEGELAAAIKKGVLFTEQIPKDFIKSNIANVIQVKDMAELNNKFGSIVSQVTTKSGQGVS